MRCPNLKFDRRLSGPNTFRVCTYGPGFAELECIVKTTDQHTPVRVKLLCSNTRGHGARGAHTRYMFRIDQERFCVESGVFQLEDGTPADLPRMGLVLTDVPESCAWLKKWEPQE